MTKNDSAEKNLKEPLLSPFLHFIFAGSKVPWWVPGELLGGCLSWSCRLSPGLCRGNAVERLLEWLCAEN